MIPHYNVIIATPGRSMEAEYVRSLVKTTEYLQKAGISYKYVNQYSSQVSAAREATTMDSDFLDAFNTQPIRGECTYDTMIWIDSDISWEIEDFMKIYESDKDIISGVYFNHLGVPMFSVHDDQLYSDPKILQNAKDVFEIFAAGFGFIAIKQGVFEKMPRPWFETVYQKIENGEGKEMLIPFGEDYSWCAKARQCGFEIYLDPSVRLTHHKKIAIKM
jgi:hypothetical protein